MISLGLTGGGLEVGGGEAVGDSQSPRTALRKRDRGKHCLAVLFSGHRRAAPGRCNGAAVHLPDLHRPRGPALARRILAQKDCRGGASWVGWGSRLWFNPTG